MPSTILASLFGSIEVSATSWIRRRRSRRTETPAWSLVGQLTIDDVRRYLDERCRQGFNAILINLLEHHFSASPPRNAYGDEPFIKPGDFGTPNDLYFERVEAVIEQARARGILVFVAPAYAGLGGGARAGGVRSRLPASQRCAPTGAT